MSISLLRGVAIMEPSDGLDEKLRLAQSESRPLKVKLGFDPTAPDLHLGHAVVLRKLRDFQEAGHHIVVIIGDFTASIGDPTGRNMMRPPLSREEINVNAQTYLEQLGKVVDLEKLEVRRNSDWHDALDLRDTIALMSKVTAAQILQREDFKKRLSESLPIHLHELLYPILQGYDSVAIEADIELGGTDQLFNNLMGRHLQHAADKAGQIVITMPLLVGLDGSDKMSKSKANYIGLTDEPFDMYGKTMSISDEMIRHYLELASSFSMADIDEMMAKIEQGASPMTIKRALAHNIVEVYHGTEAAVTAAEQFTRIVQNKSVDLSDMTLISVQSLRDSGGVHQTVLDFVSVLEPDRSRKSLKRLIAEGGVRVNGEKVTDPASEIRIMADTKVLIGKRKWFLLTEGEGQGLTAGT